MNSSREPGSHLRLIFSTQNEAPSAGATPKSAQSHQLSFPYPAETTVFFVFIDSINREDFEKIVGEFAPRWIIDVRTVPRLDTIAASRISAFNLFQKAKAAYVDLFGKLGIRSYRSANSNPAVWGNAVIDILRGSERKGPYLFLFDDEPLLEAADRVLPSLIKPAIGKTAQFARIGHP